MKPRYDVEGIYASNLQTRRREIAKILSGYDDSRTEDEVFNRLAEMEVEMLAGFQIPDEVPYPLARIQALNTIVEGLLEKIEEETEDA